MSEKNKIQINREKPSSEVIREQENFEGIVSQHRKITKRPIYKQKKFYFVLFLIITIVYLIYQSEREEKKSETEIEVVN